MGSLLQAFCPCGYRSREIFAGGGFDGGRNIPGRCDYCREIITINPNKKRVRCTRCGRKPVALEEVIHLDEMTETIGEKKAYLCPKCNSTSLTFEFIGTWD
jgi:hypothetical protein